MDYLEQPGCEGVDFCAELSIGDLIRVPRPSAEEKHGALCESPTSVFQRVLTGSSAWIKSKIVPGRAIGLVGS